MGERRIADSTAGEEQRQSLTPKNTDRSERAGGFWQAQANFLIIADFREDKQEFLHPKPTERRQFGGEPLPAHGGKFESVDARDRNFN
jgi:hypothetical protein